jgi:hypothetical protein
MHLDCFECGATVEADDLTDLGDRFLAHARNSHEWPHPRSGDPQLRRGDPATDRAIRPGGRSGELVIHPVAEDRLDDWAASSTTTPSSETLSGLAATAWNHTWPRKTRLKKPTCLRGDTTERRCPDGCTTAARFRAWGGLSRGVSLHRGPGQ